MMAFIVKSGIKKNQRSANTWKRDQGWLLSFEQGLKSLTHAESWKHLCRGCWCSSNRQEASDSTTHLLTAPVSRSGWQPRRWLHSNDAGVHSDGWEACGQIQGVYQAHQTPLGLRRVQVWHYLKLHWGLTSSLIFHSKTSTFFLKKSSYPLWLNACRSLCTHLLDRSFCIIHLVLKNPTDCCCNTLKLSALAFLHWHPALLPSTLKRRAVFAETLATPLI